MTDYYVINDHISGHRPLVYIQSEFIKVLNNNDIQALLHHDAYIHPDTFLLLTNVSNIYLTNRLGSPFSPYELHAVCDTYHPLTDYQLRAFQAQAGQYLTTFQAHETYPEQAEYYVAYNLFGNAISVPVRHINPNAPRGSRPVSHSTSSVFGYGRVGHPQFTFAYDNRQAKLDRRQLQNEYPTAKISHLNRRHRKNHPIDFPVFDDNEYGRSRRSAGWKESTKCHYQWQKHVKAN